MSAPHAQVTGSSASLCKLFGLPNEAVDRVLEDALPDLSDQLVAFTEATEASAAADYAQLTRRSCARFESVEAALKDRCVAVLLLRFSQLSARTLEVIANSGLEDRASALGLILTTDATGQPLDYSVFATAYRLSLAAPIGPRTTLYPWLPGDLYAAEDDGLLLAADADPAMIREALSRDNALTTIGGHSDGIDIQAAAAASICGVRGWKASAPGQVMPRCLLRSWCHRRRLPMSEALSAPEIIDPDVIRSRVLLLDSCFGIPFSDRLYHRSFSLFNAILTGSQYGALVTHCEVTFLDMDNTERLGDALRHPSGIGYGLVSHLSATKSRGDRPILLGDPALVLKTGERLVEAASAQTQDTITPRPLISLRDPANSLLATAVGGKGADSESTAIGDKLLSWLIGGGMIDDTWVPLADLSGASDGPNCTGCGARTRLFASRTAALSHARHLVLCPVCGIVADRRSTETVLLSHGSASVYSLSSKFCQPVRAAALRFESADGSGSSEPYIFTSVRWPVSEEGVPQPAINLGDSPPPGMNRITGIFIHDEDITVLTLLRVV